MINLVADDSRGPTTVALEPHLIAASSAVVSRVESTDVVGPMVSLPLPDTSEASLEPGLERDSLARDSHTSRRPGGSGRAQDHAVKDMAKVFKLLADETRLKILLHLTQTEEMHVRALCDLLKQSQPAVSHHLALLRVAELIEGRREGKHNFYRLLPHRFQELLDTFFASVPKDDRRIRFEDYVLAYSPSPEESVV